MRARERRVYLYVDVPNGPNYLNTMGSRRDILRLGLRLQDGMRLKFWNGDADEAGNLDDLLFEGTVYEDPKKGWYAIPEENSFCHESDLAKEKE